jgi:hypothetical protein
MSENPSPSRNEEGAHGHGVRRAAVGETAEDEHDTQGHGFRFGAATPNTEDEEDVTGHVQPPRDVDGLPPHPPIA